MPEQGLSPHLRSRQETGDILRSSEVPVIELRASIIIGSGSLSFELIRALTERLPVMICPRWVATPTQPIAIEDVLEYLVAALDLSKEKSRIYEIGGPDVVSYGDIMREYARQRGLRRLLISVPLLTPYLSSLWLGLVTPVYARVGRKLVEGLRTPTVVRDMSAQDAFPIRPRSLAEAIRRAAVNEDRDFARLAGPTPFPLPAGCVAGVARGSARGSSIHGRSRSRSRPTQLSRPSSGSAAWPAGTTATSCGSYVAGSICWLVVSVCAGDAGTQ